MGKIAILADTHFGIRKNSELILENQKRFFNEQFFPYLQSNGINEIFILGDIFDSRPNMNINIMNEVCDLLKPYQYTMLVGNHDSYLNTSTKINSLKLFKNFSNIDVIESMQEKEFFGKKFLFVPWIFDEKQFLEDFKKYKSEVCFGHFDLNGFSMGHKISDSALMPETFQKFKKVFSGHFHAPQSRMFGTTEFIYCGSPMQYDWGEVGQRKGFYIFNTDTLEYEFIENTVSAKHIKITYGEEYDPAEVENNFVKLIVKEEDVQNEDDLEKFTNKLSEHSLASVSTVIIKNDSDLDNTVEINEKGQTLLELISEYINIQDSIENKKDIQGLLQTIYEESLRE